jgi:hypothetical protein
MYQKLRPKKKISPFGEIFFGAYRFFFAELFFFDAAFFFFAIRVCMCEIFLIRPVAFVFTRKQRLHI